MKKTGRRYEHLSSRIGLVGGPFTSMEWMQPDYDDRTFRQITEELSSIDFINELLDILFFDVVNGQYLSQDLGVFEEKNNVMTSQSCFNLNISKIELHFDQRQQWCKTELESINLELNTFISTEDINSLLSDLGFEKESHAEQDFERFIKKNVDVWYYKDKKPTISFNYKKEESGFKILKIAYEGQPFS